ncbi:MAG TPA: DinB family protein, partial [Anaerolineales bacterium]|nr:DinB family protein [Anaerolineales bacterium]
MKELFEYRRKLMARLVEAAREFRAACLAEKDPHAPLEDGWSVHQVAVHTRDVDKVVYGLRVRRTAVEDNPEFPNFDGNVYLAENYDASEPLNDILDSLVESTGALVELLQTLPAEAWSRPSRHATLGSGLTLQSWVEKNLAHI